LGAVAGEEAVDRPVSGFFFAHFPPAFTEADFVRFGEGLAVGGRGEAEVGVDRPFEVVPRCSSITLER
jgi:hypothetical protein